MKPAHQKIAAGVITFAQNIPNLKELLAQVDAALNSSPSAPAQVYLTTARELLAEKLDRKLEAQAENPHPCRPRPPWMQMSFAEQIELAVSDLGVAQLMDWEEAADIWPDTPAWQLPNPNEPTA